MQAYRTKIYSKYKVVAHFKEHGLCECVPVPSTSPEFLVKFPLLDQVQVFHIIAAGSGNSSYLQSGHTPRSARAGCTWPDSGQGHDKEKRRRAEKSIK